MARRLDLERIVYMLADDPLGSHRECLEDPLPHTYQEAFAAIDNDPNNLLLAADVDGQVVGVAQLTFLPNLTYCGAWRAQIEGVRVDASVRGGGIGQALVEEAVIRARERGCVMVQLTTDTQRPDALRFYELLGFVASHHGMKLRL